MIPKGVEMPIRRLFLFGASVAVLVAGALQVLTSSAATALGTNVTNRVIVVLRNQEPSLPATSALEPRRQQAIDAVQAPILSELSATHAHINHRYSLINALAATVSPAEEAQLKANPAVAQVVPDQAIRLASPLSPGTLAPSGGGTGNPVPPLPGACATPPAVQLDPQALGEIKADSDVPGAKTARSLGFTGTGVKVAFIADGLDINNQDFIRPNGQHVFVDYQDFSGEGLNVPTGGGEAFLDASSIAAQGRNVYNVQNYSDLPLNRACNIRVEGVAPGASLVALDIFGMEDTGFNSAFLQAIDYAVTHDHVNVLNESLGNNYYPDDPATLDLVKAANDAAVTAGTTVTVSSGDAGVTSTIGTPSTDPNVISAGATTTYRLDAQDGYGGARFPGVTGWLNDNISSFSSGGFEESGRTIDVAAPGELNWALCSTDVATYSDCTDYAGNAIGVQATGGTSESAPLTAGVAALVIEAYRSTHQNHSPSPAVVKQIITSSADDIGAPADQQGAGLIDAYKAVLAAKSYRAARTGQTLLESDSQLNAIGQPGTPQTLTDTITNNGAESQTYLLSTRTLGAYTNLASQKLNLGNSGAHIVDWQGVTDDAVKTTFTVPPRRNRLNVEIAFHNASPSDLNARVRMTLIDPNGKLASYDVPQGDGNYGDAQVTDPAAGTWTAWIYSRNPKAGGSTGPVEFSAKAAAYTSFGQVTPSSLTLAPGQSGNVTLNVSTPATPGDTSGAILLTPSATGADVTSIPVTLRSLIPTGRQSFVAVLTGGNGRGINTGETFFYQMDVPSGEPELNATVTLANNPNNPFGAWLISPSGEPLAYAANDLPSAQAPGYTAVQGAQLHVLAPAAGRWTLIVGFMPQVSGDATATPFTVATDQAAVPATATGLPNSSDTVLTAGNTYTYNVTIKNRGTAPEAYFLDARQPTTSQVTLGELNGNSVTVEPTTVNSNIPVWLVPTHTTELSGSATTAGTLPIQFDLGAPFGDPDIGSNQGTSVSAAFSANPIGQGVWDILPQLVGPTDNGGSESVTSSLSATIEAFDPMVTPGQGDVWFGSVNPASLSNVVLPLTSPTATASLPVTITPTGPAGTIDQGTLYVDDANLTVFQVFSTLDGNEVAAIPYSFKVG
jgi:Peptidase inhibitor I9